jgi:hypothetical protein
MLLVKSPCRVPAQRDLERKRLLQGIGRPCGENAAGVGSSTEEKTLPPGQRVLDGLSGVRLGGCVEMKLVRHNTVTVEKCDWIEVALLPHSMLASPSRRGRPRRVSRLASIRPQSAAYRTPECPTPLRRVPQPALLNLVCRLRVPLPLPVFRAHSLSWKAQTALGKFRHKTAVLISL